MTKQDSFQTQKKQHEGQQKQQVLANLKKTKIADTKGSGGKISGFNCFSCAPAVGPENPRGLCRMAVVCHAGPGEVL